MQIHDGPPVIPGIGVSGTAPPVLWRPPVSPPEAEEGGRDRQAVKLSRHSLRSERESRCVLFGTFVFARLSRGTGAAACSPSPASPVETISSPGCSYTDIIPHKGPGIKSSAPHDAATAPAPLLWNCSEPASGSLLYSAIWPTCPVLRLRPLARKAWRPASKAPR
jgi:hypothetical protein